MEQDKEVQVYFEEKAKAFDDIYDDRGSFITRLANKIFRKGMKQRYALTMQICGFGKKSVLDLGCGAGRFAIPLAEKGMEVVGLDYSKEMIDMAEKALKEYESKIKNKLKISYLCSDFVKDFFPKGKFDISIAMGVFDYLNDPLKFLVKMKEITKGTIIASFPKKYTFQAPIRAIWLWTKKCPVYYYTKKSIAKLCLSAGIKNYKIINVDAGYVLKATS